MSDDKAYTATPAETLEQHIMDVNIAKSEAEWWANRTIEALRAENARLERLICRIYSAASNIDADKLSPGIIENIAAIVHANRNAMGENDE